MDCNKGDKPVYISNNPATGAYKRRGEGDYRCTKEDIQAMYRDAFSKTQDMIVIEKMDLSVFDYESVSRYRRCMKIQRPGHVWEDIDVRVNLKLLILEVFASKYVKC